MDFKTLFIDRLATAILIVGGLWFLAKFLLRNKFDFRPKRQQGGHHHLDELIKQQKLKLGKHELVQSMSGNSSDKIIDTRRLREMKNQLFQQNKQSTPSFESVEYLLQIENDNQWGDGKVLQTIAHDLTSRSGLFIPTRFVREAYRIAKKTCSFIPLSKTNPLFSTQKIIQVLESCSLVWGLRETLEHKTEIAKSLSQDPPLDLHRLRLAISHWIQNSLDPHPLLHLENLLIRPSIDFKFFVTLIDTRQEFFYKQFIIQDQQPIVFESLLEDLKQSLVWIDRFTLASSDKKQGERPYALSILELDAKTPLTLEVIKSAYNKKVIDKHPDRFSSLKLSAPLEKYVHENFTKLQKAYEFLKSQTG